MPAGDHGDRRVVFQTGRLDVEERYLVKKLSDDSPFIEWREAIDEVPDIFGFERFKATMAFFDELTRAADGKLFFVANNVTPRADTSFVKLCEPYRPNSRAM